MLFVIMRQSTTYCGCVQTPEDAGLLVEACRLGILPRIRQRLSEEERFESIKSGSVFVWDEKESCMRRWTDGRSWSVSRLTSGFMIYREMEGGTVRGQFCQPPNDLEAKSLESGQESDTERYRQKPGGLVKKTISIRLMGRHLHVVSYYTRAHLNSHSLLQPTMDPKLRHIFQPVKAASQFIAESQRSYRRTLHPAVHLGHKLLGLSVPHHHQLPVSSRLSSRWIASTRNTAKSNIHNSRDQTGMRISSPTHTTGFVSERGEIKSQDGQAIRELLLQNNEQRFPNILDGQKLCIWAVDRKAISVLNQSFFS